MMWPWIVAALSWLLAAWCWWRYWRIASGSDRMLDQLDDAEDDLNRIRYILGRYFGANSARGLRKIAEVLEDQ